MTHSIHIASAMFAGHTHARALELASQGVTEHYGAASLAHFQACPQNGGVLDEAEAERLADLYPNVRIRPHANVRVMREFSKYDASTPWAVSRLYFETLAAVNRALNGPAYSLHAGRRSSADLATMKDNVLRVQDTMGCPVAVEGLYPDTHNDWLLASWDEYEWLLSSGLNFAVDVSHLNIVAHKSKERRDDLVRALLASPACREVHISTNSGGRDEHRPVKGSEWWWPLLDAAHPDAVFFSEGLLRPARPGAAA